jgi:hypothetical protein
MFEVAWCVMLYTTVLAPEFAPLVLEKFKMSKTIKVLKRISVPIVIAGVLLSICRLKKYLKTRLVYLLALS